MSNIPQDVFGNIFSRFCVKSLLRLKCVCKTWLSFISDSSFAILQFEQTAKHSPQNILISTSAFLLSLRLTNISCGDGTLRKLDFPYKKPDSMVHIIGSCNGLVCIALDEYKQFFIWNPSTGVYRSLPELGIPSNVNRHSFGYGYGSSSNYYECGLPELDIPPHENRYLYGFGYDSLSHQYKVFFATRSNNVDTSNDTDVRIFATKENCWRRIQLNTSAQYCDAFYWQQSRGSLLNESLHWLSCPGGNLKVIAAFSLAEEKLFELPVPNICSYYLETLGVVDGCLCLIIRGLGVRELWMMKKYGSNPSWKKIITFGNHQEIVYDKYYKAVPNDMVPLCSTIGDQVILMANGNELIRCKLWGKTYRKRTLQHFKITSAEATAKKFFDNMEATAYRESLMSPL